MGKRKRQRRSPATAVVTPPEQKTPWWRRPLTWLLAAILGVPIAYGTAISLAYLNANNPAEAIGEKLAGQDPVKVLGMERLRDENGRAGYIVPANTDPRPLARAMKRVPNLGDRVVDPEVERQWATENNAIDVSATAWQITLEGNRTSPLVITDIKPVEIQCGKPLTGGYVNLGSQGEGDKPHLEVTIDGARPVFDRVDEGDEDVPNYFSKKTINLELHEKMVLVFIGRTNEKHCTWRYRLSYMDGSAEGGHQTISAPGGKPFESTGAANPSKDLYAWVIPGGYESRCGDDIAPIVSGESYRALQRGEIKCV